MKKLLLIVSFLFTLAAKAQTSVYHPFPDSDAVWNVVYYYGDHISCWDEIHYSYVFGNDTLIGGLSYHKIIIPFAVNVGSIPCSYVPIGYRGAIRQDTTTKKVYFVEQDSTTEKLLYNFNLKVGDTLKYGVSKWAVCSSFVDTVATIDSILIGNTYRKQFWFNGLLYYQLIEGIGSNNGLLELPCPTWIEEGLRLNCFQQNGKTLYPDSTTTCDIVSSVNNLSQKNISITLSPNPFHTTATIEIKNEELKIKNWELRIYDVMGRVVQSRIINNQSTIINRDGLGDGLYFYQLRTNNYELIATGKFVVE